MQNKNEENKRMSFHAASCAMGVSHTGSDILKSDWLQIAKDLDDGRTTAEKVAILANLAFEMGLVNEFHYMRLIKAAIDSNKRLNLASYMTVDQIIRYRLLKKAYRISKLEPFSQYGSWVEVEGNKIVVYPMLPDGSPDNECGIDVTAPEPGFLEEVNRVFNTKFKTADFDGR